MVCERSLQIQKSWNLQFPLEIANSKISEFEHYAHTASGVRNSNDTLTIDNILSILWVCLTNQTANRQNCSKGFSTFSSFALSKSRRYTAGAYRKVFAACRTTC